MEEELLIAKDEAKQSFEKLAEQAELMATVQEELQLAREEAARLHEELATERDARAALEQVTHSSAPHSYALYATMPTGPN